MLGSTRILLADDVDQIVGVGFIEIVNHEAVEAVQRAEQGRIGARAMQCRMGEDKQEHARKAALR